MSSLAERNYLSIGQVVNLLRGTYPDLSNSKIRFLEDEGLITPHRTPKGYRQYSKRTSIGLRSFCICKNEVHAALGHQAKA